MYEKDEYFELVDAGLERYKSENENDFPPSGDYDWRELVSSLIAEMGMCNSYHGKDLVDFSPWEREDYFAFVWNDKVQHTVILDSDAHLEWTTYDELKEEMWSYQEKANELERRLLKLNK